MPDREKVIKGLECRARRERDGSCDGCEYFHPFSDDPDAGWCDSAELWKDALALLKEQEAVEPLRPRARGRVERFWVCGECGAEIDKGDRFCRYCGRETKWED